jgi:hypothetical protein
MEINYFLGGVVGLRTVRGEDKEEDKGMELK